MTSLLERLAPSTCGGPGCVAGRLSWFVVLREEPARLVLHFLSASVFAVLLPGTLLPPEFFLLVGLPRPLRLVVLLHVLQALPAPLLSSPATTRSVTA